MEDILILAKDKQRARIFEEEGLLDSLMWLLGCYFEKSKDGDNDWARREISKEEHAASKTGCHLLPNAVRTQYCSRLATTAANAAQSSLSRACYDNR